MHIISAGCFIFPYLCETPFFQRETACRDTPSCSAGASCDRPASFRFFKICSDSIYAIPPFYVFIIAESAVAFHHAGLSNCQPEVAHARKAVISRAPVVQNRQNPRPRKGRQPAPYHRDGAAVWYTAPPQSPYDKAAPWSRQSPDI